METPNTFKLLDEVEWTGHELQRLYNCAEDGTYDAVPTILASIRRSLVRIETMIEEKGNV